MEARLNRTQAFKLDVENAGHFWPEEWVKGEGYVARYGGAPRLPTVGEAKVWKLGPPKNKRSRYVVVSGDVARRLQEHVAGRGRGEHVFTGRRQPWRYGDFHEERWKPACAAVAPKIPGKRLTPHMLRHTCVVWALAQGARIEQVSDPINACITVDMDAELCHRSAHRWIVRQREPARSLP